MNEETCQIVIVGHSPDKLVFSIDKEYFNKLILITDKFDSPLSGSEKALKTDTFLKNLYEKRQFEVEHKQFSFSVEYKPIAELTHLIFQQKLLGYDDVMVNISGGLRYIDIWFYIACAITSTKIIHGDFIYREDIEIGIHKNNELATIHLGDITSKQLEFMELFFQSFESYDDFFNVQSTYEQNSLLTNLKEFDSIEQVLTTLQRIRGERNLSRGAINGLINNLKKISALNIEPQEENKKRISLSYIGIAFFLNKIFNELPQKK